MEDFVHGAGSGTAIAQAAFDHAPLAMLVFTPDLQLLAQNRAHEAMTGTRREDVLGKFMFDAFPPNPNSEDDARRMIAESVARVMESGEPDAPPVQRHDIVGADGSYQVRYWDVTHAPLLSEGRPVAVIQTAQDVTRSVLSRRIDDAYRRTASQTAGVCFGAFEPEGNEFDRTADVDQLFGFEEGELPDEAGATPFFDRIHEDDLPEVQEEISRAMEEGPGAAARFDFRVRLPSGELRSIRVRALVERAIDGARTRLVGSFVDVSDIEASRAALEEAVRFKDTLVVEAHHRIKNSLQLATSMLRMQSSKAASEDVRSALSAASARLRAIADAHAEMFLSADVTQIDVVSLLGRAVDTFAQTMGAEPGAIKTDLPDEECLLQNEAAVSLGMIANELLANAAKHSIGEDGQPDVSLAFACDGAAVSLIVSNPVTAGGAEAGGTGVGRTLIDAFRRTLGAEVEARLEDGVYTAELAFEAASAPAAPRTPVPA